MHRTLALPTRKEWAKQKRIPEVVTASGIRLFKTNGRQTQDAQNACDYAVGSVNEGSLIRHEGNPGRFTKDSSIHFLVDRIISLRQV